MSYLVYCFFPKNTLKIQIVCMKKNFTFFTYRMFLAFLVVVPFTVNSQIVISQYYEGTGTNKWIELTNLGSSAVNTSSPQLKLGLWSVTGSTGSIAFTGAATNTYNLTVTIPAKGSVLIGTTSNGTEVPYLTAASANETANSVINFNGNDGVALMDASNNIIDKFGEGINAVDISYVRSSSITTPKASFTLAIHGSPEMERLLVFRSVNVYIRSRRLA